MLEGLFALLHNNVQLLVVIKPLNIEFELQSRRIAHRLNTNDLGFFFVLVIKLRVVIALNNIVMMNRAGEKKFNSAEAREKFSREGVEDETSINAPLTVRRIEKILRQVQRELCLIKLCWPDISRTTDFYSRSVVPDTYQSVSNKERLLLWHAENFRRQFHAKHASRRPLLMVCENECEVQVGKI